MAQKSKSGIIAIILAALVAVASLIVLGCVVKHKMHGHHGMDHAAHHGMKHGEHGDGHSEMYETGEGIAVEHSYARANGASAKAGAAFMVIKNFTDEDDLLVSASANVSKKAELHTHKMDANGLMVMGQIEGGLAVPAHSKVELKRGGNHVMMMGLNRSLNQGDMVTLTLVFEKAGEVIVEVPVDLKR